jgi:hypothetical protein
LLLLLANALQFLEHFLRSSRLVWLVGRRRWRWSSLLDGRNIDRLVVLFRLAGTRLRR